MLRERKRKKNIRELFFILIRETTVQIYLGELVITNQNRHYTTHWSTQSLDRNFAQHQKKSFKHKIF